MQAFESQEVNINATKKKKIIILRAHPCGQADGGCLRSHAEIF